ncbi:hypothetical protein ACH5RR_028416, partial [Cinchona calisaya]
TESESYAIVAVMRFGMRPSGIRMLFHYEDSRLRKHKSGKLDSGNPKEMKKA